MEGLFARLAALRPPLCGRRYGPSLRSALAQKPGVDRAGNGASGGASGGLGGGHAVPTAVFKHETLTTGCDKSRSNLLWGLLPLDINGKSCAPSIRCTTVRALCFSHFHFPCVPWHFRGRCCGAGGDSRSSWRAALRRGRHTRPASTAARLYHVNANEELVGVSVAPALPCHSCARGL